MQSHIVSYILSWAVFDISLTRYLKPIDQHQPIENSSDRVSSTIGNYC